MFVGPSGGSLFRSSDKQTLISHIIRSPVAEGGAGLGVHSPLSDSIETALPLHMYARLLELRNDWLTFWKQPMLDVTTAHKVEELDGTKGGSMVGYEGAKRESMRGTG